MRRSDRRSKVTASPFRAQRDSVSRKSVGVERSSITAERLQVQSPQDQALEAA